VERGKNFQPCIETLIRVELPVWGDKQTDISAAPSIVGTRAEQVDLRAFAQALGHGFLDGVDLFGAQSHNLMLTLSII